MSDPVSDLFESVRSGDRERVAEILKAHPQSVSARDRHGATPLHYAAESGRRDIVNLLLDAGADINARDRQFHATPAGWAIEFLRERGALLGMEIEDALHAIERRDVALLERYLRRLPALRHAVDRSGKTLRERAASTEVREIARLFDE